MVLSLLAPREEDPNSRWRLYTSGFGKPTEAPIQERWQIRETAPIDVFSDALLGKKILVKMTLRGQGADEDVASTIMLRQLTNTLLGGE